MPENLLTLGSIFLSYAREDTEAALRIADALRAFGIEVWFDQSELRGGDSWDAKIWDQIRACVLFLPVISAASQARSEGYFRREWKLAADRTHASGTNPMLDRGIWAGSWKPLRDDPRAQALFADPAN